MAALPRLLEETMRILQQIYLLAGNQGVDVLWNGPKRQAVFRELSNRSYWSLLAKRSKLQRKTATFSNQPLVKSAEQMRKLRSYHRRHRRLSRSLLQRLSLVR